jgi:glycosidase
MKKKALLNKITIVFVKTSLVVYLLSSSLLSGAQITQHVSKVVLQAFWWDYWNSNYPFGWANYLTELAPRLKSLGIDAVWIPPSAKNASPGSVGYSPFDLYDLGDKYQKGGDVRDSLPPRHNLLLTRTRSGTKDELLRLVAVLHANGIEVINDMVLNHLGDAGANLAGIGGKDPEAVYSTASAAGFKNFRYACYKTPVIDESLGDYWSRSGRWARNYQNFHPNPANNCNSGEICGTLFGPDNDYAIAGANGQSSNVPASGNIVIGSITRPYFNPVQGSNYMNSSVRDHMKWFTKQTGMDGFRFDAVKHFDITTQRQYTLDVKYNIPSFAAGGQNMLNFAEWVAGAGDLDNYVNNIAGGGEEHTGTFDFSLRGYGLDGGIYSMVLGNGAFNMQSIPGAQQNKRYYDYNSGTKRVYRTVPFVNSHDTYRPILSANGNFSKSLGDNSGWDVSNELGGNGRHIDPREPRLGAAYAIIFAVDGNPTLYIEDLFDLGTTGKRYSHLPTSEIDLPVRKTLANITSAHQKLDIKTGAYGVPTSLGGANAPVYAKGSSGDHLVIERAGKAIVGITDAFTSVNNNSQDQETWVTTDASWIGKKLIDYSGSHGLTETEVFADRRVLIKTTPNGHNIPNVYGRGYSIWAPMPDGITFPTVDSMFKYLETYSPDRNTQTTQEWEMADDLGDSHCKSLGQGGRIPDNVTNERVVGRIFSVAETPVTIKVLPEFDGRDLTVSIYKTDGTLLATQSGSTTAANPITVNHLPAADGWLVVKVRNTVENQAGQKCWVNVTYTAPKVVDTKSALSVIPQNASVWTGNKGTTEVSDCGNWEGGLIPGQASHVIVYGHAKPFPVLKTNLTVNKVTVYPGAQFTVDPGINLTVLSQ